MNLTFYVHHTGKHIGFGSGVSRKLKSDFGSENVTGLRIHCAPDSDPYPSVMYSAKNTWKKHNYEPIRTNSSLLARFVRISEHI